MKYNYKPISVKLVGSYEGAKKAWIHSRPHIDPNDSSLNDLSKVNLPVNGFNHYHFEITSSLLVRDLLYMIRPSNNWARSNRTTVINEDTLFYSEEYKSLIESDPRYHEHHLKSIDQSIPLDVRKSEFAFAVSTDYSFMCDARTLSNLVHSLESVHALSEFLDAFKMELADKNVQLPPSNDFNIFDALAISGLAVSKTVHSPDQVIVKYDSLADNWTLCASITCNLNSQFIRQEFGTVKSTLVNRILVANELSDLPAFQSDIVISSMTLSRDRMIKLVKTRSCWFAQWDKESMASWSRLVTEVIKSMGLHTKEMLICEGSCDDCKWKAEQLCRTKAGNPNGSKGEVNMPCPILTGIPEVYEMRGIQYNSESELFKHWKGVIDSLKLELTDIGKEFLRNVFNYGYADPADNTRLADITNKLKEKYKDKI